MQVCVKAAQMVKAIEMKIEVGVDIEVQLSASVTSNRIDQQHSVPIERGTINL